jgi:2-aminoadipate transaminase
MLIEASKTISTLQLVPRGDLVDLGRGQPDPTLLPTELVATAAASRLALEPRASLGYGANRGPGPLLEWLLGHLSKEGRTPALEDLAVTPGTSPALDSLCSLLASPGEAVLVEARTYDLALRLFRERGLRPVPIPGDGDGPSPAALADLVEGASERPAFAYLIPTFNNPTGLSMAASRRREILDLAARLELPIVEDDAYRELGLDAPAPPSLWAEDEAGRVVRLGSFSKCLAPGLRVGWITGPPALVDRYVGSAMLTSGGGANHFAATVVGELCAGGKFDGWVATLRDGLRRRRDALCAGLDAARGIAHRRPAGGYFVWVRFDDGPQPYRLAEECESLGVAFARGERFGSDGAHARLSFAHYPPEVLEEGARRLTDAVVRSRR